MANMRKYKKGKPREPRYKSASLEAVIAKQIQEIEGIVNYETMKIKWVEPESNHTYTPDYVLKNGIIIEAKGYLDKSDREKHVFVKEQYPELDIRFVFQRPNNTISKASKTTYWQWAEKKGFKWAAGSIPLSWFKEEQK